MRRRANVDSNQAAVTGELRMCGVHVEPKLSRLGDGVPDLLCSWRGLWFVVELKNPDVAPSKRKLTKDEQDWHDLAKAPVIVAETASEIMDAMRVIVVSLDTPPKGRP